MLYNVERKNSEKCRIMVDKFQLQVKKAYLPKSFSKLLHYWERRTDICQNILFSKNIYQHLLKLILNKNLMFETHKRFLKHLYFTN